VCRRFDIEPELPRLLIHGCRMDTWQQRYATETELHEYCYHVASVVGLMCVSISGRRDPATEFYAVHSGLAVQRTNILRDVLEDAQRGRVYLPADTLERFELTPRQILDLPRPERPDPPARKLHALLRHECGRVRELYATAEAALSPADRRALVPLEIMRLVYYRLLEELERAGAGAFNGRVRLGRGCRMGIALSTMLRTFL
jgi:phytoene synthase